MNLGQKMCEFLTTSSGGAKVEAAFSTGKPAESGHFPALGRYATSHWVTISAAGRLR
jgi:hypothetical protein